MNTSSNTMFTRGSLVSMAIGIVVVVGILVALYYFYTFLYNPTSWRDVKQLFSGNLEFSQTGNGSAASPLKANQRFEVSGITDGGEFSFSTWIYIADARPASVDLNRPIQLFEIGNRDTTQTTDTNKAILFGGLIPSRGTLLLRMGTTDPSETLTSDTIRGLLSTTYTESSPYSSSKCDIPSIEFQRWVLVSVSVNSRTVDIYIDGKLARSCVYKAPYTKQSGKPNQLVYLGLGTSQLKGSFASPTFTNYAMSPDEIWNLYMAGPTSGGGLLGWFKDLFSVEVKYKVGDQSYTL